MLSCTALDKGFDGGKNVQTANIAISLFRSRANGKVRSLYVHDRVGPTDLE